MNEWKNSFEAAYEGLNSEQRLAVDTVEGPVMVVAGPGTGKTQILTLRIAHILRSTDAKPEHILALTFTDAGAQTMRERLVRYIGTEAYRVPVFTFHGFAESLIRQYPDSYTRVVGGRPASELEKIHIIESILETAACKLLRPNGDPAYYVRPILSAISSLKQEHREPDDFAQLIQNQEKELAALPRVHEKGTHKGKVRGEYSTKEKCVNKNKELLTVYRQYEALLTEKRLYDFDDMIVETIHALENNEDMLRDLQETYQYIHADEHQDVNGSQNRILELLASYHEHPNIFVVGDEKQAIFRFQGASLENFLYFEDVFQKTKTIALTENYRSGQPILDIAHSLVAVDAGPLMELRVPLRAAARAEEGQIFERDFSHQAVEDSWLVEEVKKTIAAGTPPEEIACIVRTNREVEQFALLLRKAGIAVRPSAEGDILEHPITQAVQACIDAVVESSDESALFAVLHGSYWGLSHDDLIRIMSKRNYERSLTSILSDAAYLEEIGVKNISGAQRVIEVLTRARELEVSEAPQRVLEYILTESGFLAHVVAESPLDGVRVVRRLYDEIEEMVRRDGVGTLRKVSELFRTSRAYRLALGAPYIHTDTHAVEVMTAHKSKGREFEVVYIPHLIDSAWGGTRSRKLFDIPRTKHLTESDFDAVDDERRLLYVALTRAKGVLHLSHSKTNSEGKTLLPSRLREELDGSHLTKVDTAAAEKNFDPLQNLESAPQTNSVGVDTINTLFTERGLSATHLNNYLRSPWDYFYRNLLRMPETQSVHMQYGTAMHSVMERITRVHTKDGTIPSDTEIKKLLEQALGRLPITKEEYVRALEQGLAALYAYVPHATPALPVHTKEEFGIRVHWQTGDPDVPEILLTGNLDRLDFDADGTALRVVDYKTGKPKTRGVVEGTTKNSNGDYKRQLVFYALLLSLYDHPEYMTREGMLAFLEPDDKGRIHEELFHITDAEIEELKTDIIRVSKEITQGTFLSTSCDPLVSEYCVLAERFRAKL